MKYTPEIHKDNQDQYESKQTPTFVEELAATKEVVVVEEKPKEGPEKTIMRCLPATLKEHKDSMYGEVKKTIKTGDPFAFEGIIISQTDMQIKFWAMAPIGPGSIIFQSNERSWWRVIDREEKSGGWILYGVPSDTQPSF